MLTWQNRAVQPAIDIPTDRLLFAADNNDNRNKQTDVEVPIKKKETNRRVFPYVGH